MRTWAARWGIVGVDEGCLPIAIEGVVEANVISRSAGAGAGGVVRGGIVLRRELFGRLEEAERVTAVSAPGGSGKTVLLRSWIRDAGLADRAAWVAVEGGERDPRRFWVSVVDALRGTAAGSELVRPLGDEFGQPGYELARPLWPTPVTTASEAELMTWPAPLPADRPKRAMSPHLPDSDTEVS